MSLADMTGKSNETSRPALYMPTDGKNIVQTSWDNAMLNNGSNSALIAKADAKEEWNANYESAMGTSIEEVINSKSYQARVKAGTNRVRNEDIARNGEAYLEAELEEMRKNPELQKILAGVPPRSGLDERAREMAVMAAEDWETAQRHTTSTNVGLLSAATGMGRAIVDPLVMVTLPMGIQGTVAKTVAAEMGISLLAEVPIQKEVKRWHEETGQVYTDEEMFTNIMLATVGAGALGGGMRAIMGPSAKELAGIAAKEQAAQKVAKGSDDIVAEVSETIPEPMGYEPSLHGFETMTRLANVDGISRYSSETLTLIADNIHAKAQNPAFRPDVEDMNAHRTNMQAANEAIARGDTSALNLKPIARGRNIAFDAYSHASWDALARTNDIDISSDKALNQFITSQVITDLAEESAKIAKRIIEPNDVKAMRRRIKQQEQAIKDMEEGLDDVLDAASTSQGARGEKAAQEFREVPIGARTSLNTIDTLRKRVADTKKSIKQSDILAKEHAELQRMFDSMKDGTPLGVPKAVKGIYKQARRGVRNSRKMSDDITKFEKHAFDNPNGRWVKSGETLLRTPLRTIDEIKKTIDEIASPEVDKAIQTRFDESGAIDKELIDPAGQVTKVSKIMDDLDVMNEETNAMGVCGFGGKV